MLQARLNRDVLEMWVKGEEVCQEASVLKYNPYCDRAGSLLLPCLCKAQQEISRY